MLLIDGVKYEEWKPELEEEEFEPEVLKHVKDIFGENSLYFDKKQKLRSLAGVGSIPDGLAIMFGSMPKWYIVEVELSSHDPYQHVVPQVDKFINAVDNPRTQNRIIDAMYDAVSSDELIQVKTKQATGQTKDIHKFLSDLITAPPVITIIVEKETDQLKEALKKYNQKRVIEFRTFVRQGVGLPVHAHLFEPAFSEETQPSPFSSMRREGSVEVELRDNDIKYGGIYITRKEVDFFPNVHTKIELRATDGNAIHRTFDPRYHGLVLREWFSLYQVKAGDTVRITPIEAKKKYLIEFTRKKTISN